MWNEIYELVTFKQLKTHLVIEVSISDPRSSSGPDEDLVDNQCVFGC